nr:reverse transcriptase domain-containing protein [Tanacetum cinerariifolium]
MMSLIVEENPKGREETPPLTKEQIETDQIVRGKAVVDDDLKKPFKEAVRTPVTRRIIKFAAPEYKMPENIKLYDEMTNPEDHLGRKQLEMALESGKLNHIVKDVKQRGRGNRRVEVPQPSKIINMIGVVSSKERKRKNRETFKKWMNVPITFPPVLFEDVSDEPLIGEAEVEEYPVRRVYVDEGVSVEFMFEHCFENLCLEIESRLKATQIDLVGFSGEISKPLGKIELDTLRVVPSTIQSMMKFPTPKGIATLVTRPVIISECQSLEKIRILENPIEESTPGGGKRHNRGNHGKPSFRNQLVVIGGGLSGEYCKVEAVIKIQGLEAKVDCKLVACQINREYVDNSESMAKYLVKAKEYIVEFKTFSIKNIPQNQNQKGDVLRPLQANYVIREIHMGVCGMHSGPRAVVRKAI